MDGARNSPAFGVTETPKIPRAESARERTCTKLSSPGRKDDEAKEAEDAFSSGPFDTQDTDAPNGQRRMLWRGALDCPAIAPLFSSLFSS